MTKCTAPGDRRLDGDSLVHAELKSAYKWLPEAIRHHHHLGFTRQITRTCCLTKWSNILVGRQFTRVFSSKRHTSVVFLLIFKQTRKSCMLTASCCVSLRSGWGTLAQLEMHAVSRCVVSNGDFICCVSACQLALQVCPGYDLKLSTPSVGANDLCC